jgi:two-component system cell cycle response regulator
VFSLLLGIWGLVVDVPGMAVAAGAVGFLAGLIGAVSLPEPTATPTPDPEPAAADTERATPERKHDLTHPSKALGDSRPSVNANGAALLNDPESGLFSEAYMRVALESRLASARRHLRPVGMALMYATEEGESEGEEALVQAMTEAVQETVREADIACRMDNGIYAIILEDTPENGAVWTVERVRRNLVSHHGHHTLWAGVACYPAHALESEELLTQAKAALLSAKEWNQDRIEVATSD